MGDCRANLYALPSSWPYNSFVMKQLKDAAVVVAVPYDRLACMSWSALPVCQTQLQLHARWQAGHCLEEPCAEQDAACLLCGCQFGGPINLQIKCRLNLWINSLFLD
jgi:hypothetical protein